MADDAAKPVCYDIEAIKAILPHREPFLLIDEVLECEPGHTAKARKYVRESDWYFQGHFPNMPIMPGVLQLEAIAQTGGIAVLSLPEFKGKIALFAGVDKVRFRRPVLPGDVLEMEITINRLSKIAGWGVGVARVNGQKTCECQVLFTITDPKKNDSRE